MDQFSDQILQRVAAFSSDKELLDPRIDPIYVGLSGGPDSVALLHILHELGYKCIALHCNFHLRGEESDRDEAFCVSLCQTLGVKLKVKDFDTHQYMRQHQLSLEMAARKLRYDWWQTEVKTIIALGHHQDDSIETMLLNLMRGTGLNGLTGIVPFNAETSVIRPLLCLTRQEILQYLNENDLSYVTDSTNAENDTPRNQIRNQLLPLIQQIIPQARIGLVTTMQNLQGYQSLCKSRIDEYDWMTTEHEAWGIQWAELSLSDLRAELPDRGSRETFIHEWKNQYCNPSTQQVIRTATQLYTSPIDPSELDRHRPVLKVEEYGILAPIDLGNNAQYEDFDYDSVQQPLQLRRWQEGDRMAPLGMKGHTKLVSDLFSNEHYSPMQKATTWLVCDASGAILWVIGLRISEQHKVKPDSDLILRVSIQ